MVSIHASYNNRHHKTISADLASGKTIRITISLPAEESNPGPTTQPPTPVNNGTSATGVINGTVFKTKAEAGKTNPYDLEGVPIPNSLVTIKYVQNGQNLKTATTDGSGKFRFTGLPLNVNISISSRSTTLI